jgi:hypothetical protein
MLLRRQKMSERIEIPDEFMGVPVSEDTLKQSLENGSASQVSVPVGGALLSINGFEYVPSIGLYVSKERELNNKNWNECQKELHLRGDRMITPYEFTEFIKHLRGKSNPEPLNILNEILEVRYPWRAEWLDASFEVSGDEVNMKYHEFDSNGGIDRKEIHVSGVLTQDKLPGINLSAWIGNNEYGLPRQSVVSGNLYYWHPRAERVAWFYADSDGADLGCNGNPGGRGTSLGVRAVRRNVQKNSGGRK